MKILILFGPFAPFSKNSFGGVEKFWYTMATKFNKSGHEVHIISKKINKLIYELKSQSCSRIILVN